MSAAQRKTASPPTAISERVAARVFAEEVFGRSTGVLTVLEGKLKRLFCLEQGDLIFAASNLIEEQFDAFLADRGSLAAEQREALNAETRAASCSVVTLIRQRGLVPANELEQALKEHAQRLLFSALKARDSDANFACGTPRVEAEMTFRLAGIPLVFEYARRHPPSIDRVRVRIGPPNARPVANEKAKERLNASELDDAAGFLLQTCDGTRDVANLVELSPDATEPTLRALHALLLLGALSIPESADETAAAAAQISRKEAETRLTLAEGATHYGVLGVGSLASDEEIRSAYYYLAKRYHPDRLRAGPLEDLVPKFEVFFTQVTEAYNTLANPDLRKQYDQQRAEAEGKIEEVPEHDKAYLARQNFARAKILIGKRQFQAAVNFLENAIELDDHNATYHLELGKLLTGNPRRRGDAEQALRRALERNPALVPAYLALGQLFNRLQRKDDAIRQFREVLRWEPGHLEATSELQALGVKV